MKAGTVERLTDDGNGIRVIKRSIVKVSGVVIKSKVKVAGLAVRADDTGRVLMLQRANDPEDPAGGTWEFPGGHLEGEESPIEGAHREWSEETGMKVPDGELTGAWHGKGKKYAGFVHTIPHEADLPIFDGRTDTVNPDDPDGDQVEALAWWDPDHMEENPALREELLDSLKRVHRAIGHEPTADKIAEVTLVKVGPKGYVHGWIKVGAVDGIKDVTYSKASGKIRHRGTKTVLGRIDRGENGWFHEHENGHSQSGHRSAQAAARALVEHHNEAVQGQHTLGTPQAHAPSAETLKPGPGGWRYVGDTQAEHPVHGVGDVAHDTDIGQHIILTPSKTGGAPDIHFADSIAGTRVTPKVNDVAGVRTDVALWNGDVKTLHDKLPKVGWSTSMGSDEHKLGDQALGDIFKRQGFDAKPTVGGVDQVLAAGGHPLWRGLAGENAGRYADEFMTGRYHPGFGLFGNGTYAAGVGGKDIANSFANFVYGSDKPGGAILKMALTPDAKVGRHDDLQMEMALARPSWTAHQGDVFGDTGRYAAAKGYDAYGIGIPDQNGHYLEVVVLNRGKVVVERVQ